MHDGIHVEKAGIPSATICTDSFIETSKAMATMWGDPNYPVIFTPHPIASLTKEQLQARVEEIINQIVSILTGEEVA